MKEREIKIIGYHEKALIQALLDKGAVDAGKEEQTNIRISSSSHPVHSDAYLRLRKVVKGGNALPLEFTYKERQGGSQARINEETTVHIQPKEGEVLLRLLAKLGYDIQEMGLKSRHTFLYKDFRVEFDTWDAQTLSYPYIEVEGPSVEALDCFLEEFSIPRSYVSTKSIGELRAEEEKKRISSSMHVIDKNAR